MNGRPLLVFGAGGHGKVVADAARSSGWKLLGWVDDSPARAGTAIWDLPVITWEQCQSAPGRWGDAAFAVAVGDNAARERVQARLEAAGREVVTVVHARATISPTARLGAGTVVMAGAVVNPDAVVGRGCIVNTGAVVEHDCRLGGFVHLSPNAALGGTVTIGDRTHLGLGAVALPGIFIGSDVKVGAGGVVIRDVPDALTVVGVPAWPLEKKGTDVKKRIYLSVPHMGSNEERYVREAFASNWLSTVGPNLDAFEREFAARVGLPAVALSSGTAALHLALRLVGVGPGDEVVSPTLTFVGGVNPIRYLGAKPVFVDSDPATWMIHPGLLEELLARKAAAGKLPKAVIAVHLYGQSADMDPILAACARYDIPVVEDAAEAVGTLYKGKPAGTLGAIGIYSFNGNKIMTTTGGGMLVSRRKEWVDKARFWSQQARDPGLAYEHTDMGYNYRLSNVLAGIGRGQLEVLDQRVEERRAVAFRYRDAFADLPGISLMPQAPYGLHTNWLSCFLVDADRFGATRDDIIRALHAIDAESRPIWKPMHLQPLFASCERAGGAVAEDLFRRGICLPSSSSLSPEDQDTIVAAVRGCVGKGRAT
jgi:pyridoxal phosphate-dependent aminotransferase EpsN